MGSSFLYGTGRIVKVNETPIDAQEVATSVVHLVTKETITKHNTILDDPLLRDVWSTSMCKELSRTTQGFDETKGTDTIRFIELKNIGKIPQDRVVTYSRIVVNYRAYTKDTNRVKITLGMRIYSIIYTWTS